MPELHRSRYDVKRVDQDFVYIVDTGHDKGFRSITNDVENVVIELFDRYGQRRFIYQDSLGNWDEMLHIDRRFVKFVPFYLQPSLHGLQHSDDYGCNLCDDPHCNGEHPG